MFPCYVQWRPEALAWTFAIQCVLDFSQATFRNHQANQSVLVEFCAMCGAHETRQVSFFQKMPSGKRAREKISLEIYFYSDGIRDTRTSSLVFD